MNRDLPREAASSPEPLLPNAPLIVRGFAVVLGVLLLGYMFMGRGFAHLGFGPLFVGDWVLLLGLATAAIAIVRYGARLVVTPTIVFLIAFMVLGAIRTIPYVPVYGMDALRDGVLWGYAVFALIVVVLFSDLRWLRLAARAYGWVVPVFAVWLPICWSIFRESSAAIDPARPGSYIPPVFFKAGDMAVHSVGAIAFLVLAAGSIPILRAWIARFAVSLPLAWTVFLTGAASRGAILAAAAGLGLTAITSKRVVPWAPVLAAAFVVVIGLSAPGLIPPGTVPGPSPSPISSNSESPTPGTSQAPPTFAPTPSSGRAATAGQWIENLGSIVGSTSDSSLDGTKNFRIAWWKAIAKYTLRGPYFWTGKGFGINLADADGFQPTADHSLRAPHNSHMSVLARMGVPGAVLWALFQLTFAIGLLRAILAHRRRGERMLPAFGSWVLVVWAAMMVVTSFDPYLEGPQGGIWFWVIVGLGLVVTARARRPSPA